MRVSSAAARSYLFAEGYAQCNKYPLRESTTTARTASRVSREGSLIALPAMKAARAWVAQLGQRRSVEVAVPQGFAGSNPAPRISTRQLVSTSNRHVARSGACSDAVQRTSGALLNHGERL